VGRSLVNVISPSDVSAVGKAIIIAGGYGKTDYLWTNTDYMADMAFNTLLYRGFSKENIHYLSCVTKQDSDGNGLDDDDVDLQSTLANAALTFTKLVSRQRRPVRVPCGSRRHAGRCSRRVVVKTNEYLSATQLDQWLDAIQDTYSNNVTVVIDCCNAGSFLNDLTDPVQAGE